MINFKKISAIAGSGLMIGMTMGVAAAANYPAPFVAGGAADVAIVYGTGSGVSILDAVEAGSIQANLQSFMTGKTSTTGSVSGEAAALFTGGTKIYVNDSLNVVKTVLTKSELPTVLVDGSFSGDVDATTSQKIDIGSNPLVTFKKQPTSDDDPLFALTTSTTQTNYIYNATLTFSKAVNASHADSEGEDLTMFGTTYVIAAATDTDTLVLLKSAEKLDLSSDAPSTSVTVSGATYTVELVSASDTAATVKVTDSAGTSESREINEAASKKVNGITIAVTTADETNLKLSASVVAGADKVTLEDGSAVTTGEDNSIIDGTLVDFGTGNPNNLTKITVSVYASESDKDAIKPGESFTDPVYGSFKLDFSGFNIDAVSTARETVEISPNSDDKSSIKFTDHRGNEKSFQWSKDVAGNLVANFRGSAALMSDDSNRNISIAEMNNLTYQDLVVVGNEDEGYLLKLSAVKNQTKDDGTGYADSYVKFTDVFSGEEYTTKFDSDGVGTSTIGGKIYNVYLQGARGSATEDFQVKLDYPDSSGNGVLVLFPTIETSKGAKVAFYEPTEVDLTKHGVRTGLNRGSNVTEIKIPDGDGYESATVSQLVTMDAINNNYSITFDGNANIFNTTTNGVQSAIVNNGTVWNVGGLKFNVTNQNITAKPGYENDTITIYLVEPDGAGNINQSALIVWEEKDDNTDYQATIILLENGRTSDDGLGVDTSGSGHTWENNDANWRATRASDSKVTDAADLWGTILTLDAGDSDQPKATLSYPDEQLYAQLYFSANDAVITAGGVSGGATQLGDVLVKDSEVSSVSSKNLVVVGGSCINSVAANLVDAGCGSAFTDSTGVGSGQFLIQSFGDAYTTGKVALLVAGYDVSDTVNAAKYLRTQAVKTDASTKYVGTSSTSAELQTTETSA